MATSDPNDFHTLERVTDELEGLVDLSTSIAKLQILFKSFIELCEGLVSKKRHKTFATNVDANLEAHQSQQTSNPQPLGQALSLATTANTYDLPQLTPATFVTQETEFSFTPGDASGVMDPGWGLFDVQPTLDWLDADFSFFDSEQYQQE